MHAPFSLRSSFSGLRARSFGTTGHNSIRLGVWNPESGFCLIRQMRRQRCLLGNSLTGVYSVVMMAWLGNAILGDLATSPWSLNLSLDPSRGRNRVHRPMISVGFLSSGADIYVGWDACRSLSAWQGGEPWLHPKTSPQGLSHENLTKRKESACHLAKHSKMSKWLQCPTQASPRPPDKPLSLRFYSLKPINHFPPHRIAFTSSLPH